MLWPVVFFAICKYSMLGNLPSVAYPIPNQFTNTVADIAIGITHICTFWFTDANSICVAFTASNECTVSISDSCSFAIADDESIECTNFAADKSTIGITFTESD